MEAARDTYRSLHTTQGQELQEAAQQLTAARQQGQEAVMAAEARAAAERAPLDAGVVELQAQLSATQLELDRVTAQLEEADAKFGVLKVKLARAGKEKERAAAALVAATTTHATLQQDKLQLDSNIKGLQAEKEGIVVSTVSSLVDARCGTLLIAVHISTVLCVRHELQLACIQGSCTNTHRCYGVQLAR
jgi:chromosome segregation ATPase